MRPSETTSGQEWLSNFIAPDAPVATILLDSLRFVSLSTMRNGLKHQLEELAASGELRTPALILPERSMSALGVSSESSPVAFRDFEPGAPLDITPGSDGFVAGILRDFARSGRDASNSPWIAPDADLARLRDRRCRSIMLVTDYVGSGDQVLALAEAIARHPTIRSWRSLHRLDICILTFAASADAFGRVGSSKAVDRIWAIEAASTFATASWTNDVHDAIIELCLRACRTRRKWALGYGGTCGLFATERGVPNNLPAVFWQRTQGWHPLFPNRVVPSQVAQEVNEYRLVEPLSELAVRVGQLRLGRSQRVAHMRPTSRELLRVLVLLNRHADEPAAVAAELGIDFSEIRVLFDALREFGLVDPAGRLSDAGRRELNAQKRGLRRTTAGLAGSDAAYYPTSLK
jgi:hypothetical protein